MSPSTDTRPRSAAGTLLAGVIGGLIVLAVGAVLIATGVIHGTTKREVVNRTATAQPTNKTISDNGGRSVSDIYRQEGRGVMFVEARGVQENSIFGIPGGQGTATGSGFLIHKDGTILTNAHVVEGSSKVTVRLSETGDAIPAQVKGRDASSDLAVLKVDPKAVSSVTPVPLGNSSSAQVGDPVIAIGNPFGFTRTVTTGIVSAKARQITAPNGFPIRNVIQTDASVNPGNSGGPLLDARGRVIGINSQIATGGGQGSVGIAFAIPINSAKQLLPRLERGGKIEHAYLGVEMAPVTKSLARQLKLPGTSGAFVQSAVPNGPAAKAGLHGGARSGDVLVKVAGQATATPDDVANAIASKRPGDRVTVEYYRGGQRRTATVTLAKRPASLQNSDSQGGGGGGLIPLP